MFILETLPYVMMILMFVSICAIIKPFRPFKTRKIAVFVTVASLFLGGVFIDMIPDSPEDIAAATAEIEQVRSTVQLSLEAQDITKAKEAVRNISANSKKIKFDEITALRAKISSAKLLGELDVLLSDESIDDEAKFQKLSSKWSKLKRNTALRKLAGPGFEQKLAIFVKSIPAYKTKLNQNGYSLLIEAAKVNGNATDKYTKKLKTYDQQANAKTLKKISDLEEQVAYAPNSNYYLNITLYKQLVDLAPDEAKYKEKLKYFTDVKQANTRAKQKCSADKIGAYVEAMIFIESKLKSPRSAKFPMSSKNRVAVDSYSPNCIYRIRTHVDSQNGFGAMIRTNWYVKLEKLPNGRWKLLDISIQ